MKAFLMLCCLITSLGAAAQQKQEPRFKSLYDMVREKPLPATTAFPFPVKGKQQPPISSSKIIILPLDNMPCLVPDMSGFNMPVAGQQMIVPNTMPVLRQVIPVK